MEHNTSQSSKTKETFSTSSILEAFERAQARFVGGALDVSSISLNPDEEATTPLRKKIVRTPDTFKFLSVALREQGSKETEDATTTDKFPDPLLKANGIAVMYERVKSPSASLTSRVRTFPEFPWVITSPNVVVPEETKTIFKLRDGANIFLKYEDSTIKSPTEFLQNGAREYDIKECNNWHRVTLLNTAATTFITTYQGNAIMHEPQVTLFANPLFSQAFGFFTGNKKLFSPEENPSVADVRPDGVMGFFSVKTPEPGQNIVVSTIPNSEDLCVCLQLLLKLGVCLGTNEVLLPVCVAEYKSSNDLSDIGKLAYEMDRLWKIHDMIWKVPPKVHYGIYIEGSTWYIRGIHGPKREVSTVWKYTITNLNHAIYVAAVVYRFAAFLLDMTSKLEPDFDKLKKWITRLAEEKVDKTTLDTMLDVLKGIGGAPNSEPKSDSNDDTSDANDSNSESENDSPSEDLSHVVKLLDLLVGHGFKGIKLLKNHGETKIYECRKGNGKGAIKIGPWNRIEREANALLHLRGPGVERLLTFAQIENSQFGYMILERLYPLPRHIKTAVELQEITVDIMGALARIHGKNYLHRDVKRSNIMMDSAKNVKLIDFECAMEEDAEDFDVFYGTNFYKPRELDNSHTPYCMTPQLMRSSKLHGSVEADSYSAALVCASLMYDIDIEADVAEGEEENIFKLRRWLNERKIAHVATPNAEYVSKTILIFEPVDLFRWMLVDNPALRLSAAQSMNHPFITEGIPENETNEQTEPANLPMKSASGPVKEVAGKNLQGKLNQSPFVDKENLSPNVITQH